MEINFKLKEATDRGLALLRDDLSGEQRAILVLPPKYCCERLMAELIANSLGIIKVGITRLRADSLGLPLMQGSRSSFAAAPIYANEFITVEARSGVSTGISAADRSLTARLLSNPATTPDQLVQPGHIVPIEIAAGGSLARPTLVDAGADLSKLITGDESVIFADLLDPDGEFADLAHQERLCTDYQIPLFTISEVLRHRIATEEIITEQQRNELSLPESGDWLSITFLSKFPFGRHLVLKKIKDQEKVPIIRVQRADGTLLTSPDHGSIAALSEIHRHGHGALLYLFYDLSQTEHQKSAKMAFREYGIGAQIISALGFSKVELITTTKKNLIGINNFGVEIIGQRTLSMRDT
jgi:3,4-dihydroxy 2-butanone 4-phosphate synthase/GTP cyclohydrolase II